MWGDCVSGAVQKSVSLDALDPECTADQWEGIVFFPGPSWFLRLFKHLCVALFSTYKRIKRAFSRHFVF